MKSRFSSTGLAATFTAAILVAASACSDDTSVSASTSDASNATDSGGGASDAAVEADAAATTCPAKPAFAGDPWTVFLVAFDSVPNTPLPGALAELVKRDDATLVSGITGADGKTTVVAPTGGKPLDVYVRMTAPVDAGVPYATTRSEIEGGLQGNTLSLRVYQMSKLQERAQAAGRQWNAASAVVEVAATKCVTDPNAPLVPIEGATIGISGGSPLVYLKDLTTFDASATATTSFGRAVTFDVPPGSVTITTTKGGVAHAYSTVVIAGQNLITVTAPL